MPPPRSVHLYNLASCSSVAVGDLDGDGSLDVVVAFAETDEIAWFRNSDGLGDFAVGADVAANVDLARRAIVADIDGDGDLDVVSASWADGTFGGCCDRRSVVGRAFCRKFARSQPVNHAR